MEYRTSRPLSSSCPCGSTKLMLQINKPGNMSWFDRWRWLLRKHLRFQMKRRPCQCYSCLNYFGGFDWRLVEGARLAVETWSCGCNCFICMGPKCNEYVYYKYIYMYSKNRIYVAILIIINLYYYIIHMCWKKNKHQIQLVFITHPNPYKKNRKTTPPSIVAPGNSGGLP